MFPAKRKRKFYRETRPRGWFGRRRKIRERFCPKCERPYLETPIPTEIEQFVSGSVAAVIYPMRRFGRKQFVVRTGRWQSGGRGMWLGELLEQDDLPDLIKVTAEAREYIDAQLGPKAARRW